MQDFLLIHLILVDFILPLLKSYKVILYPGLSLTHGGVPKGSLLPRKKYSYYVLQVLVLSSGLSSGFAKVSVIPNLST